MDLLKELDICLRARFTLIVFLTVEEERALEMIKKVCEQKGRAMISWDAADGFTSVAGSSSLAGSILDPLAALHQIENSKEEAVYVLLDFHDCWNHPPVKRKLRSLSRRLKATRTSVVVLSPVGTVPEELRNEAVISHLPLPEWQELDMVLGGIMRAAGTRISLSAAEREALSRAAVGLTALQAQRIFAKALVRDGKLDAADIDTIGEEKQDIIRGSQVLEYYPVKETASDVGGLGRLKEWVALRSRALSSEALAYNLPAPKGIALIGIPGTGKSLSAKMIGAMWHMPVVRFDVGALFRPFLGQSEESLRNALRLVESVAPCVLWIDEIEKALAQGDTDGGTSRRILGQILTWMQEKPPGCFLVATANDVSRLPPEMLRRGRFDEIFFLDLPTLEERRQILEVHIRKRGREPKNFDLGALAEISSGYVGAEIEQAIGDAMFVAFNDNREFNSEDITQSFKRLIPLSVSQRQILADLQAWIDDGRAQPASDKDGVKTERLNRPIGF